MTASLTLSLVLAEAMASLLAGGAYPFLNLFEADARFGVRLKPEASTRVRSRTGRITTIRTNRLGFRGQEWPATASEFGKPRLLLVGDSQMMGYGVRWEETVGPELARRLPAEVLTAAVPSWGPEEYALAIEELVPRYRPRWVLFVGNAANDWFEASVPNPRRTTARDGWAINVRGGGRSGPGAARSGFPGRAFLLGRSHLVLAARRLFAPRHRGSADELVDRGPADTALRLAADLPALERSARPFRSRLTRFLLRSARACRAAGCEVLAVGLPLDVQVSAAEWKKYRTAPVDLRDTERLLTALVEDARAAGLKGLDLLPVLRAAQPGAFLPDDYHLSARGHAAAAGAIARLLSPPPAQASARASARAETQEVTR